MWAARSACSRGMGVLNDSCAWPRVAVRGGVCGPVRGGACGAWRRVRCVVARAFFGGIAAMR